MKINESFRSAADKYGEEFARQMLNAGIPDRYVLSACRFHCNPPNKPIDVLSIQFRQWMTYVTPYNKIDVNCLSYDDFTKLINEKMAEWICPNKLYDDGNVSVGVFLTKKDAEKYPLKTMAGNDFCTSNACGFNKYTKQGYRLLSIYDKGRGKDDALKYVIATVKDGIISIWNAANYPIGDTSEPYMNDAWRYLDSLPDEAQKIILEFAKQTKIKELKSNKCMKKTINEARLKQIVAESVRRVLKEELTVLGKIENFDAKRGYNINGYNTNKDTAYIPNKDYIAKREAEEAEKKAKEDRRREEENRKRKIIANCRVVNWGDMLRKDKETRVKLYKRWESQGWPEIPSTIYGGNKMCIPFKQPGTYIICELYPDGTWDMNSDRYPMPLDDFKTSTKDGLCKLYNSLVTSGFRRGEDEEIQCIAGNGCKFDLYPNGTWGYADDNDVYDDYDDYDY